MPTVANVFKLFSFSKGFVADPSLRFGFIVAPNSQLASELRRHHVSIFGSFSKEIDSKAGARLLALESEKGLEWKARFNSKLKERLQFLQNPFNYKNILIVPNQVGLFGVLKITCFTGSDVELCKILATKYGLGIAPLSIFGWPSHAGYFRISLGIEMEQITKLLNSLEIALETEKGLPTPIHAKIIK